MNEGKLEQARENLVRAFELIDRLGEFFAAEHVWLKGVQEDVAVEWQDWTAKVASRLDYLGFVIPEVYEAQVHLAHALRDMLVALEDSR